jgi:hypothetical protein
MQSQLIDVRQLLTNLATLLINGYIWVFVSMSTGTGREMKGG